METFFKSSNTTITITYQAAAKELLVSIVRNFAQMLIIISSFFVVVLFQFERPIHHRKLITKYSPKLFYRTSLWSIQRLSFSGTHWIFCCLNQSGHRLDTFLLSQFRMISNNNLMVMCSIGTWNVWLNLLVWTSFLFFTNNSKLESGPSLEDSYTANLPHIF